MRRIAVPQIQSEVFFLLNCVKYFVLLRMLPTWSMWESSWRRFCPLAKNCHHFAKVLPYQERMNVCSMILNCGCHAGRLGLWPRSAMHLQKPCTTKSTNTRAALRQRWKPLSASTTIWDSQRLLLGSWPSLSNTCTWTSRYSHTFPSSGKKTFPSSD